MITFCKCVKAHFEELSSGWCVYNISAFAELVFPSIKVNYACRLHNTSYCFFAIVCFYYFYMLCSAHRLIRNLTQLLSGLEEQLWFELVRGT